VTSLVVIAPGAGDAVAPSAVSAEIAAEESAATDDDRDGAPRPIPTKC
jgi:hypothetical protein